MLHGFNENFSRDQGLRLAVGALGLSVVFGGVAYYIQDKNSRCEPVAFSEFGKTARAFEKEGKPVPALTHYYSIVNDMSMQVFEAFNLSNGCGAKGSSFATELEFKTNRGSRVHRQIGERAGELPAASDQALRDLEKFTQALAELPAVVKAFDDSWRHTQDDVYMTKTREHTVCDIDGKNCHTETERYEEYDHTVHHYRYFRENGQRAAVLLADFLTHHPDLTIAQELIRATSTEADNEYAIETSMKKLFEGKMPTNDDYLAMANSWADGSNYTKYRPVISAERDNLAGLSPRWRAALQIARSQSYTTYSKVDSGPAEYRVAGAAEDSGNAIMDAAGRVIGGVVHARAAVPELEAAIAEYIDVSLNAKPGDEAKLKKRVIETAQSLYERNYEGGLPVRPFSWPTVCLFALLGGALGAAGVAGFDRWQENKAWGQRINRL